MDDDLILISEDGIIIRIQANTIRKCSRHSRGVRVMRIKEGNKIVAVTKVQHEENTEELEADEELSESE